MYVHYIIRPTKIHSRVLTPEQSFIFWHSSDDHRLTRGTRHPTIVGIVVAYTCVCIRVNVCTYILCILCTSEKYPPNRWITRGGRRVFTRASTSDKQLVVGRVKNDNIVFFSKQIWTRRPPAAVYAEWPFLHVLINILYYNILLLGIWFALADTIKRVYTGWPVILYAHPPPPPISPRSYSESDFCNFFSVLIL